MDERKTGRITKISDRGWGFIASREIEFTRIFFHWTGLSQRTLNFKKLRTGMEVTFRTFQTVDQGLRAVDIEVVQNANEQGENRIETKRENANAE